VPEGPVRFPRLLASSLAVLITRPHRAWPALGWAVGWAVRQREVHHLKRFGEAAYLLARLRRRPDHIHAHFAHGATTVALLLARFTGAPFSFTGHAKDIFQLVPPELLRAKMAEARFAVAVSEHGREHLCRAAREEDHAKVVVVRNGVDRARFAPRQAEPEGEPVALAVSRLVEKKGLDTLIDACAVLSGRHRPIRLRVVGEGSLRERVQEQVRQAGLSDRVELVGSVEHGSIRAEYERAAVFVLPCRRTRKGDQDGLPVAIVEALSVGVPVITTPISGIPEVIVDGRSGVLVPPDDPERLADAIERVLSDPALRARLRHAGQTAADRFELSSCVARLRELFRRGPEAA